MDDHKTIINGRYLTQNITGVQRFGYEMSKALINLKNDITIATPKSELESQYAIGNLPLEIIGNKRSHFWEQYDLPLYLNKVKSPLLLNFCSTAPLFYNNQIITIHDLAYLNKSWHSWAFRNFYGFLLPKLAKNAKHILTVSEFSKTELIEKYQISEERITVIYNGISKKPLVPPQNSFVERHNNVQFILCVGSIDPRKNLKSLIKAFLKTTQSKNDIKLYLVGKFNKNFAKDIELLSLINENKNIEFLGYCTDAELNWFYQHALLFVYPSYYEGFGLPPVEAMSNCCPVLTSDITSLPEVCGDAAAYCNPYSIDDIAYKIDLILNDLSFSNKLREKGLIQSEKYSWDASAKKLNELLLIKN